MYLFAFGISSAIFYPDLQDALHDHDTVLAVSGGLAGVKNEGAVDSILQHIQNDAYYPDFINKITHLVFSIIKHHIFNDGNKRTSLALGIRFLQNNGYDDETVDRFVVEMEDVVVAVAENALDKAELQRVIEGILKGST
jgi:death on curing protein